MDGKMNSNMLLIAVLVLGVGLFAAYTYKQKQIEGQPGDFQQQPQWNDWNNQQPLPPTNPGLQPPINPNPPHHIMPPSEPRSYAEAVRMAQSQNKKLFLYFGADWCSWCNKMKNETLSDARVKNALRNYIVYHVDKDRESSLANRYNVRGIPSYFVVGSNERREKTGSGYKTPDQFVRWLGGNSRNNPFRRNPG